MKMAILMLLFPFCLLAQVNIDNVFIEDSTRIKPSFPIINLGDISAGKSDQPAIYLDNVLVSMNMISGLSPDKIEKMEVVKEYEAGLDKYGKIYITLKDPNKLKLLSFRDIKRLYLKSLTGSCIYMVDGKLVLDDVDSYAFDEDYVLKIEVAKARDFDSLEGIPIDLTVIHVLKKTPANLEIRLRGHEGN